MTTIKDIQSQLDTLSKDLVRKKTEAAKIEGQISEITKNMKEQFKVNTVEEAKQKLIKIKKQADDLEDKVKEDYSQLEGEMKKHDLTGI